jgi:hypothetical protein
MSLRSSISLWNLVFDLSNLSKTKCQIKNPKPYTCLFCLLGLLRHSPTLLLYLRKKVIPTKMLDDVGKCSHFLASNKKIHLKMATYLPAIWIVVDKFFRQEEQIVHDLQCIVQTVFFIVRVHFLFFLITSRGFHRVHGFILLEQTDT